MSGNEVKLTAKQRMFVAYYLDCFNATEAARRAGYSEKTAYSIGSENLRKPEILAEIERQLDQIMPKAEILGRLAQHARGTMEDFFTIDEEDVEIATQTKIVEEAPTENGTLASRILHVTTTTVTAKRPVVLLDLREAKRQQKLHLLKKYTRNAQGEAIELHDAQTALVQLGKYHKLWTDKAELTGKDGDALIPSLTAEEKAQALEAYAIQQTAIATYRIDAGSDAVA